MANERIEISTYTDKQHRQYIEGVQKYDPSQGAESAWIPQKTTTSAARPYIPTEFDQRFSLSKPHPSAHFFPPNMDREGLFFWQAVLPSDSYEKRDVILEKLASFEETLNNLPASARDEFTKVKGGIETLEKITRMLGIIKAQLNRLQRG